MISIGYMIWGIIILAFAFISTDNVVAVLKLDPNEVGKLQGIRMIFFVLIPMMIGSAIGETLNQKMAVTEASRFTYFDEVTGGTGKYSQPTNSGR